MSEDFSPETIQSQETTGTSEAPTNALHEATRNLESQFANEAQQGTQQTKTPQTLVDLDKLEQFVWKGKTLTRKELESGWLRQQDYTRKTQALKESERQEKPYWDNLKADLSHIRNNPALIMEFKRVYPAKFHTFAEALLPDSNGQQQTSGTGGLDPQLVRLLDERVGKIDSFLKDYQEREVAAIDTQLEGYKLKFESKYGFADEDSVLARAEYMLQQKIQNGEKNPSIDEQTWERLWKTDHDYHKQRFETINQRQLKEQKTANSKGADVPAGGSAGTRAPQKTSLKGAREAMDQYLRGGG